MTWGKAAIAGFILFAASGTALPAEKTDPQLTSAKVDDKSARNDPAAARREAGAQHRDGLTPGKVAAPSKPAVPSRTGAPAKAEAAVAAAPGRRPAPPPGKPAKRGCLSTSETRDIMAAKRLIPPFMALRSAGTHARGETIGVRLCRHANDELSYEINVLRRDGRVVKVIVDAANGKIVRLINDR